MSVQADLTADLCVIGAGPAGASVACALARLGYSVCVLEAARFPRPHIGESLPPSIMPLLDALDVRRAVEGAGFLRPARAIVRWGDAGEVYREQGEEAGFQVDRAIFDQLLVGAARQAGADVRFGARARAPRAADGGWLVPFDGAPRGTLRCAFLVDAAGKRSSIGRHPGCWSAPTAALYAYFEGAKIAGPETRVEAGDAEWYWGAPLADGRFNATVFVDPARVAGRSGAARLALYRSLIERSALLSGALAGHMRGEVRVTDATSYVDAEPVTASSLRVGEAALSVDPLSSQGVQSAIAGGLRASVVVNTLLRRPANAALAIELYETSLREALERHRRWATELYAARAAITPAPFWLARAETAPGARVVEPLVDRGPVPDGADLALASDVGVADAPAVRGNFIERAAAVTHPSLERPVAFLSGVELAPLLESIAGTHRAIVARWAPRLGEPRARDVLGWLWRSGLVVRRLRE